MEQRKLKFNLQGIRYEISWYAQNTHHVFVKRNGEDIRIDDLPTKRKVFIREAVRRQESKLQKESFAKVQDAFYKQSANGKAEAAKQERMNRAAERLRKALKK